MDDQPNEQPNEPPRGLRALREARKLSQNRLADLSGVSQPRISNLEADPARLATAQAGTVLALSRALGVDPEQLRAAAGLPNLALAGDVARRIALAADRLPPARQRLYLALIADEARLRAGGGGGGGEDDGTDGKGHADG